MGARYRVYSQDVTANSGIQDETIIPHIGTRLFLTTDADQRRKERVQYELKRHSIRTFVLPSNLSGNGKAELIGKCKNKMLAFAREQTGFFIASVDKRGKIEPRMDMEGKTHGRKKR